MLYASVLAFRACPRISGAIAPLAWRPAPPCRLAFAHHSYAYLSVYCSAERGNFQIRHLFAVVHVAYPAFAAHQRARNNLHLIPGTHHGCRYLDCLGAAVRECIDPRNFIPVQGNKRFVLPANQARTSHMAADTRRQIFNAAGYRYQISGKQRLHHGHKLAIALFQSAATRNKTGFEQWLLVPAFGL